MNISLTASRRMAAPAERVWKTLTDFEHYRDWNPWLREAAGATAPGSAVTVTARFGSQGGVYRHRMVAAECPHLLHWEDTGWFTLFAKGERIRRITPVDAGNCDYHVELRISGLLAGLALKQYGDFLRGGLAAETDALQIRAETLALKNAD